MLEETCISGHCNVQARCPPPMQGDGRRAHPPPAPPASGQPICAGQCRPACRPAPCTASRAPRRHTPPARSPPPGTSAPAADWACAKRNARPTEGREETRIRDHPARGEPDLCVRAQFACKVCSAAAPERTRTGGLSYIDYRKEQCRRGGAHRILFLPKICGKLNTMRSKQPSARVHALPSGGVTSRSAVASTSCRTSAPAASSAAATAAQNRTERNQPSQLTPDGHGQAPDGPDHVVEAVGVGPSVTLSRP